MNSEPEHLASAYLDGELSDEERHLAERDPAVMAEVESLRALRDQLASVEPPTHEARESAIAAAMSAFHQLNGTTASGAPVRGGSDAEVVPLAPQRAPRGGRDLSRWLGVAAALVVAAALGIVAVQVGGGGDDDSVADQAATAPAATSAARVQESEEPAAADEPADELMAATEASQEDAADLDGGGDAESSLAETLESADAPMSQEELTEEAMIEATAEESASADTGLADPPASSVPLPDPARYFDDGDPLAIESPIQLQSAAEYLVDQRESGELGPTPEYRCPFPYVLARAVYRVGTTDFEVLIDVDEISSVVSAVDEPTCNVIATSPLEPTG